MIIGFCGAKQHGKGTAAEGLRRAYGFVELNIADALKQSCSEAFGIPLHLFHDPETKEQPLTILQYVGTDLFRSKWPDIWLNTWVNKARTLGSRIVVTDVRFPNEHAAVQSMGVLMLRVNRPGAPINDTHESERHFANFMVDHELINGSSRADLMYKTAAIAARRFNLQELRHEFFELP
jgi:hypothetical protein